MRRIIAFLLMFCLVFITGCSPNNNHIKLGANFELSGRLAQYGRACLEGARLAVDEYNQTAEYKIDLLVYDNRSENSSAALASVGLEADNNVAAIIGPSMSGAVKSVLSSGISIPVIAPSATADNIRPVVMTNELYRICFNDTNQGVAMGEYASKLGFKRVAIMLDSSNDYSMGLGQAFSDNFVSLGGTVVGTEYYMAGDTDFLTALTKIKALSPDAIFMPAYYTEGGMIIRQAKELGIDAAILSGDAFDSPRLDEIAGFSLDNVFFTNHMDPNVESVNEFISRYQDVYGKQPCAYSTLGYDAAKLFIKAVNMPGSNSNDGLKQKLNSITKFSGITGNFTLDDQKNAVKKVMLTKIEGGRRINLNPDKEVSP